MPKWWPLHQCLTSLISKFCFFSALQFPGDNRLAVSVFLMHFILLSFSVFIAPEADYIECDSILIPLQYFDAVSLATIRAPPCRMPCSCNSQRFSCGNS